MNNWLYWSVPEHRCNHYLFFMVLALFVLPYIFGIRFTTLGYLVNMIWMDLIYYWQYKFVERITKNKDNDEDGNNSF